MVESAGCTIPSDAVNEDTVPQKCVHDTLLNEHYITILLCILNKYCNYKVIFNFGHLMFLHVSSVSRYFKLGRKRNFSRFRRERSVVLGLFRKSGIYDLFKYRRLMVLISKFRYLTCCARHCCFIVIPSTFNSYPSGCWPPSRL